MSEQSEVCKPDVSAFWPLIIIWFTVFATFSIPGRAEQPTAESLDAIAILKVASRAITIVALGWIVFSRLRSVRTRRIVASVFPWILFIGWAILSTFWSPIKSITLGQAGGQVALLLLSVTIAISPNHAQRYIMQCILALAVYSAFYGVNSFLLPDLFGVGRSSESFIHPTALGAAASLGIVMTTAVLLTADWRWVKPVCLCTLPLFLIALLAAHGRLAIVLTILTCLGLVLFKGQSFRLAASAIAVSVLGCSYMVFDPGLEVVEYAVGSSMDFMHRGQDVDQLAELSGRAEMWTKMWKSYLNSPVIGHGYFMCSATGKLFVWYTDRNHTAHNIVLQALVSTGIIGLILFSIWMLQLFRICLTTASRRLGSHCVLVLSPAILLWFAGWFMLNSSLLGPVRPESAVFAVVVGLLIGQYIGPDQRDEPEIQKTAECDGDR